MIAHTITTGVLYLLAIIGVVVWIQRMLDAQRTPTDTQRFDDVARQLKDARRPPARPGQGKAARRNREAKP